MSFIKTLIISVLGNWEVLVGGILLSAALSSFATYKVMHNANLAAQTQTVKATVHLVTEQSHINVNIGDLVIRGLEIVHDNAETAAAEIPTHVTPEIDREYPVPLGFVRVWNKRAAGPVPEPAAGSDADPSGVPLSAVASTHSLDVEALETCRVDLTAWWAWYDQQSALWNKEHASLH